MIGLGVGWGRTASHEQIYTGSSYANNLQVLPKVKGHLPSLFLVLEVALFLYLKMTIKK